MDLDSDILRHRHFLQARRQRLVMSRSWRRIANVLRAALLNRLLLNPDLALLHDLVSEFQKGVNSLLLLLHMLADKFTAEQILPLHTLGLILRVDQLKCLFPIGVIANIKPMQNLYIHSISRKFLTP